MCFECYLVTTLIGAFLGLLATLTTKPKRLSIALVDVAIGIAGAVSMAWFLAPLAGSAANERASTPQLIGAVFGGVVWLALYKVIQPNN